MNRSIRTWTILLASILIATAAAGCTSKKSDGPAPSTSPPKSPAPTTSPRAPAPPPPPASSKEYVNGSALYSIDAAPTGIVGFTVDENWTTLRLTVSVKKAADASCSVITSETQQTQNGATTVDAQIKFTHGDKELLVPLSMGPDCSGAAGSIPSGFPKTDQSDSEKGQWTVQLTGRGQGYEIHVLVKATR